MKKRLDALAKIERLHKQMHDLAVWRQAALEREREGLVEDHRAMLEAMSEGSIAYGPAAVAGSRRVRALETQIAAAENECAAQTKRTRDQGARAKLAVRALERVEAHHREQKERKDLADLIDASLHKSKASPA